MPGRPPPSPARVRSPPVPSAIARAAAPIAASSTATPSASTARASASPISTHPRRIRRVAPANAASATRRLQQLLGEGPFDLVAGRRDTDRYGRKLRIVERDGRSIGAMLVDEGLARPWEGRRRPWC